MTRVLAVDACTHVALPSEILSVVAPFGMQCSDVSKTLPFWDIQTSHDRLWRWLHTDLLIANNATLTCHASHVTDRGENSVSLLWRCEFEPSDVASWRVSFWNPIFGCPNTKNLSGCHFGLHLEPASGWIALILGIVFFFVCAALILLLLLIDRHRAAQRLQTPTGGFGTLHEENGSSASLEIHPQ